MARLWFWETKPALWVALGDAEEAQEPAAVTVVAGAGSVIVAVVGSAVTV